MVILQKGTARISTDEWVIRCEKCGCKWVWRTVDIPSGSYKYLRAQCSSCYSLSGEVDIEETIRQQGE